MYICIDYVFMYIVYLVCICTFFYRIYIVLLYYDSTEERDTSCLREFGEKGGIVR